MVAIRTLQSARGSAGVIAATGDGAAPYQRPSNGVDPAQSSTLGTAALREEISSLGDEDELSSFCSAPRPARNPGRFTSSFQDIFTEQPNCHVTIVTSGIQQY